MRILILLIYLLSFFLNTVKLNAQGLNSYWCFGDSAGIDFSVLSMPVPITSFMDSPYSCASIGDSSGLLMYAHTSYWPQFIVNSYRTTAVHNRFHSIMQNGDSLIGQAFYNGLTFINKPGNDSLYYLLQWGFNQDPGLYYSVIDPYYNNDSGIVLIKNVQLPLTDPALAFGVTAVRHANGRDWWVMCRNGSNSNRFNLFYFGIDTIVGPIEENIGTVTMLNTSTFTISKDGDRIGMVNSQGIIEVYNFDRCSGIISNSLPIHLHDTLQLLGVEFSPNGQLLYVACTNNIFGDSLRLYQIDLSAPNPSNSVIEIYKQKVPASGGNLRRGPDDKIYFSCLHECGWFYSDTYRNLYNENLSVINYPDSIGLACNFTPFSFYLGGKRTYWSLPNNPNYNLGEMIGSVCDSLPLTVSKQKDEPFEFFPNPANDKVMFTFRNALKRTLHVYNITGQNVMTSFVCDKYNYMDVSDLKPGLYCISISGISGISKLLILH
jgi:hypothetical protein